MAITEANWSSGGRPTGASRRAPLWRPALAFVCGFAIQFDVLIGGNGEGVVATGGFGYRATDLLCVVLIALLGIAALAPRRLVPLSVYAVLIGAMALLRVLDTSFGSDGRTIILALHYLGYSFAGLYLASLLVREDAREKFCWGLIAGLLSSLLIFALQAAGDTAQLVELGLLPGYYRVMALDIGDTLRYAGLWGHPNEASHVAALAAPAAAYLFLVRRRLLPIVLTGAGLLAVFYYTQSRGGLLVGCAVLGAPFLFDRAGRFNVVRLMVVGAVVLAGIGLVSELGFIASRFDDPGTAHNFSERLNTIWAGLEILATHPFGVGIDDFMELIAAGTGGVDTPHNGFIFFGAIFGWLPLAALMAALGRNLFMRSNGDALFAFVSLGLLLSFLFEQLPDAYPFALVMCMVVGWAFINTRVGRDLVARAFPQRQRMPLRYRRPSHAAISLLGPRE